MVSNKAGGVETIPDRISKLSPSAQSLLHEARPDQTCRVNVLISKGLTDEALKLVVDSLASFGAAEIQVRPRMAMVHASVPMRALEKVADMNEIDWIDIESTAPLESLLD